MKALIFYLKKRSGHRKAAEAIEQSFKRRYPQADVVVRNAGDFFSHVTRAVCDTFFMSEMKHSSRLWSWSYDRCLLKSLSGPVRTAFEVAARHKMLEYVRGISPDVIICTQAIPCEMLCVLRARGYLHVPVIAVSTDFRVHVYWIHPEVERYCVACEKSKDDLVERGVSPEKIAVTGIPISADFAARLDRATARKKLGLPETGKVVLMMGGGYGLVPYKKLLGPILDVDHVHVVPVLGVGDKDPRSLTSTFPEDRLSVLGYVDNVHEWMDAADVLVSKPGGLTCAEAVAKEIPFVMTSPLPGQEEKNIPYMLQSGAAVYGKSPLEAAEQLAKIIDDEKVTTEMKARARDLARPSAVNEIVETAVHSLPYLERIGPATERTTVGRPGPVWARVREDKQ